MFARERRYPRGAQGTWGRDAALFEREEFHGEHGGRQNQNKTKAGESATTGQH
jgi:hypothetical protein